MNDSERLSDFMDRMSDREGLEQERYERLLVELNRTTPAAGRDQQGRFRLALFDSKSYDSESFTRSNHEDKFAIHHVEAALTLDTAHAAVGCRAVCIFVNDKCDAAVVESLAALGVELIALRCSGFNNVDLLACREHEISVVRVPAYSPNAVAEHTVALMLMLNRHLHKAYIRNRTGYFVLEGLTGFDMRGETVGVIGTGQIGRCVIDILLGFGCKVLAYDVVQDPELADRAGVEYAELPRVLESSRIVTLHVPLMDATHHLIDAAAIARMRPGTMLINTSRGGLVDTRALIDGLKSGQVGSAGLDVYEEEAGIFFHDMSAQVLSDDVLARLMSFNNVVVTSHQAFLTDNALSNIADTTFENLLEFIDGKRGAELTNAVMDG